MNIEEFSNEFDVLLNSYKDRKEFGLTESNESVELNEYEKSVFLTDAQRELVIELYSGRNTILGGYSYEEVEEVRRYLSTLNKTVELNKQVSSLISLSNTPSFYQLPSNTLFVTIEQVKINDDSNECLNGKYIEVKPIRRDRFLLWSKNPFRQPNTSFAYRIDHENNYIELVYDKILSTYKVGLLIRPTPIILVDLPYLSIEGINVKTECTLPEILHNEILKRAVVMALSTK